MLTAEGIGSKKQDAKQAAAKALLDKLAGRTIADEFYYNKTDVNNTVTNSLDDSFRGAVNITTSSLDTNIQKGNFVGALQEFCDIKKIKHPTYELETHTTIEGVNQFAVECTFMDLTASGTSNSKKNAKQKAAGTMLKLIKQQLKGIIDDVSYEKFLKD